MVRTNGIFTVLVFRRAAQKEVHPGGRRKYVHVGSGPVPYWTSPRDELLFAHHAGFPIRRESLSASARASRRASLLGESRGRGLLLAHCATWQCGDTRDRSHFLARSVGVS